MHRPIPGLIPVSSLLPPVPLVLCPQFPVSSSLWPVPSQVLFPAPVLPRDRELELGTANWGQVTINAVLAGVSAKVCFLWFNARWSWLGSILSFVDGFWLQLSFLLAIASKPQ